MTIEVEVVATETIRPSSQTPTHLNIFPLSGIDQHVPSIYSPHLLVYPATTEDKTENHRRVHRLKESLGEALTHIYPLAGRISGNRYVICNDQGINLFETRVHGESLSQFLTNPRPEELVKLFPSHDHQLLVLSEEKALLSVQVNLFESGGMVLGVHISHQFADGFGCCLFINFWARIARGEEEIHPPKLGAASTFPPTNNTSVLALQTVSPVEKENIMTKRFVFNTTNLDALMRANVFTKRPSRTALVTALIWRCLMNVGTTYVVTFVVNLRRKQLQHLSENCLGNCCVCTTTSPTTAETQPELQDLVDKLREAIRMVDSEYVKQLKGGDVMFFQPFKEVSDRCNKGEVVRYTFSSLCNFPYYETDFGWGKPIWATSTSSVGFKNTILLTDGMHGCGVEAWVTLNEQDMAMFESHPDLIAFTSPNTAA